RRAAPAVRGRPSRPSTMAAPPRSPAVVRPRSASRRSRHLLLLLGSLLLLAAGVHGPRLVEGLRERRLGAMTADQLAGVVKRRPDDLAARYQLGLARARAGDY